MPAYGEIYGTLINITNGGAQFMLSSVDLGLYGTGTDSSVDNVTLIGIDIHGNTITDTVNIGAPSRSAAADLYVQRCRHARLPVWSSPRCRSSRCGPAIPTVPLQRLRRHRQSQRR